MIRQLACLLLLALLGQVAPAAAEAEPSSIHSSPARWLATDDARDCAITADGRWAAATAGGLMLGRGERVERTLTRLEGLPSTSVRRVTFEGATLQVATSEGTARVQFASGQVQAAAPGRHWEPLPAATSTTALPKDIELRRTHSAGSQRCFATDHGLYVAESGTPARRVGPAALPSGDISAVAASDRELFVGSFDRGLFVVRGSTLQQASSEGLNPNINALAWHAREQLLWVGTARGTSRCARSQSGSLSCRRVGGGSSVHAVLVLTDGTVVSGGDGGLEFLARDGKVLRTFARKQSAPFRAVWALAEGEAGTLFVGTTNGVFWGTVAAFTPRGRLMRAAMVTGELQDDWVTALLSKQGRLYVGTYNAGLASFEVAEEKLTLLRFDRGLGYVNPAGISALAADRLAVATMDGLHVGLPGAFSKVESLAEDVTSVLPVRTDQGQLAAWVGTRSGLLQQLLASPQRAN